MDGHLGSGLELSSDFCSRLGSSSSPNTVDGIREDSALMDCYGVTLSGSDGPLERWIRQRPAQIGEMVCPWSIAQVSVFYEFINVTRNA